MSDFGFLYELHAQDGELIVTQSVTGSRMGPMLEHIAKTMSGYERTHGKGNVSVNMLKVRLNENTAIVDPKRMESLNALVTVAAEHYSQKAGKLVVESSFPKKPNQVVENLRKILSDPKKTQKLVAELKLPDLEVGDTLLVGKFKNRKAEIKGFDTDENNQPVADTTKGQQKIFKPRIAKLMPGKEEAPVEEGVSHGHVAGQVRKNKEAHPERYCSNPKCLWRVSSGPCPKHTPKPVEEQEKQTCENCGTEVGFVHRPGCTHLAGK
jgi:hypothetical protein